MSEIKWSKYQQAIFDEVENGKGHLVVQARAGCAKTTSLVKSLNHVSPFESWLLCAFNKRIAVELKRKAPETGDIRTNHSLGLKAIKNHFPNVEINNDKVWGILDRLVGKDRKWNDVKVQLRKAISLCKASLVDDPKMIDILLDEYDIETMDMDRNEFINIISQSLLKCFEDTRNVDFDDMIWFPNVYDMKVGNYDRVFIDECVGAETFIKTDQGQKVAKDIQIGDKILSYENGSAVYNTVLGKKESSQNEGLIIKTKNGHVLNMTNNHTLYATRYKDVPKNKLCLYLMYRKDLGFRIGTTTKLKTRAKSESADKYWILEFGSEEEILLKEQEYSLKYQVPTYVFNATKRGCNQDRVNNIFNIFGENGIRILKDYNYSFKYPHWVNNTAAANSKHKRNILYIRAHQGYNTKAPSTSVFRFECYSEDYVNKLNLSSNVKVYKDKKGRQLITGNNIKYSKLKKQAEHLAKLLDAELVENITINKNKLYLTNAGALFPGMKVIVHKGGNKNNINLFDKNLKKIAQDFGLKKGDNGSISYEAYCKIRTLKPELNLPPIDDSSFYLDEIISIEKSQGSFVDLEVESSSNFFANDILTHNCQDLSPGQVELALKAVSDTGRITAVGDQYQCVDENTILETSDGVKKITDLSIGDQILSYRKGKNEFQIISNLQRSDWSSGFEIETESGKKILMSPNHKIWAKLPTIEDGQKIVYIMYRKDLGYRVGKTNKLLSETNPFGHRLGSESGDKIWIIDIVNSESEALFLEKSYSLKYGIPTEVFNGKQRGLDQERINNIFSEFGDNGESLLNDKNLFFDYPHWNSPTKTSNRYSVTRKVVRLTTHHPKANKIHFEWEDDETFELLKNKGYAIKKGTNKRKNNYRIRKEIASYKEAYFFAKNLAKDADAYISERMSYHRRPVNLITASGLFIGSSVFVKNEGSIKLEKIISIKEKPGIFYDIEVDDAGNFFGNDILSHNSIYSWAGAGTDNLDKLAKRLNAKVLPLPITYRCPLKVVKQAQIYVPDIQARDNAPEGTLEYISSKDMLQKAKPGCFILSRVNAPLISLALKFISKGMPCNIQGRDIGANLVTIIKKARRKTIPAFLAWLETWERQEIARLSKIHRSTVPARDKAECLRVIADACTSVAEMKNKIQDLFEDGDDKNRVILSTVHRAKGLERDVVFVLNDTFFGGNQEERNVRYVAITRSASELYFVTGGGYGLKKGPGKKKATKKAASK